MGDVKVVREIEKKEMILKPKGWRYNFGNFVRKRIVDRKSSVILEDTSAFTSKTYQKKDIAKMVKELPDLLGAISVIVNAAVGDYKFITAEKGDDDTKNKDVNDITKWVKDPLHNFRQFMEQYFWSSLMRSMVFVELQPKIGAIDPWMFVVDAEYCEPKRNDKRTRIEGFTYCHPDVKDESGVPLKQHFIGNKQVISSSYLLDGSDEGFPPISSLIDDANLYVSSKAFVKSLYKSGGLGRLAFIGEEMGEDEYIAMKEDLKQRRATSIVMRGKIKIQSLSNTPKDMMYQEIDKIWNEKIMTVFSVPPALMCKFGATGLKDDKVSINVFTSKVRAEQAKFENTMNQIVAKLWNKKNIRMKMAKWVDPVTQADLHKIYMELGVLTPNIVRKELGLPRIEEKWADYPFNYNLWPQIGPIIMGYETVGSIQAQAKESAAGKSEEAKETEKQIKLLYNEYLEKEKFKKLLMDGTY